jgi:uncharacterized membrane protein YesL
MLTLLLCVPIVTAPAAICANNRVLMKLTLDGECRIMKEYWGEFKSSVFRYLPFFSITAALSVGLGLVMYYLLFVYEIGLFGYVLVAFCGLCILLIYLVYTYATLLFVSVDLPIGTNIKNAVLLTMTQPKRDFLIILLPFAITLITVLLLPNAIPMFVVLIPTFTTLISCIIIKRTLEESILLPDDAQE